MQKQRLSFILYKAVTLCWCFTTIFLTACNSTIENNTQTIPTPFEQEIVKTPTGTLTIPTTIPPNFEESLKTPSIQFTATSKEITGKLFLYNLNGIEQINLLDNNRNYILLRENSWVDWGAKFAQNKKNIAYWVKNKTHTELWFTSLIDWKPQLVLTFENFHYDYGTVSWEVNDRYIIFNLSTESDDWLKNIETVRTYVFDTQTMTLVDGTYWTGECYTLAPSPQTHQLALWCTPKEDIEKKFLILESQTDPWVGIEKPFPLTETCNQYATCDWLQDGSFMVFITEDYPNLFYITPIDNPSPKSINDKLSDNYAFPRLSPNGQYVIFAGNCNDMGAYCPKLLELKSEEILWAVRNNSNQGNFGIISSNNVIWDPNSAFLALTVFKTQESIIILDVTTQEEVLSITNIDQSILDIVWTAE